MTRIDCFRWDFQYLAFHDGGDEITAVITRLPNYDRTDLTKVTEGDVLSFWRDAGRQSHEGDYLIVSAWADEAACVRVLHASAVSLSSTR